LVSQKAGRFVDDAGTKGDFVKVLSRLNRGVLLASALMASVPALAEDGGAAAAGGWGTGLKYLAGALAIGLAVLGGARGQGQAAASAYEAVGRNPQAADKLFTPLLLGLALIEFQTIMAFIIAILLVI
jgi:F-type H+-transporting ATPase subunit c